jgi:hypothetical protein
VVVANPPYMGAKGMNTDLSNYLKKHYQDTKSDLFAVFMERMERFIRMYGYHASVTMHSWMFLSSFQRYRKRLIENYSITNMVHMDNMVMGIAFGTCATIMRDRINGYKGTFQYVRLSDLENNEPKTFPVRVNRFINMASEGFMEIPGSPIAYWASSKIKDIFKTNRKLSDISEPRQGMATGDNAKFIRNWTEVEYNRIGFNCKDSTEAIKKSAKWIPYNKGGPYRKWYGNTDYVVNWENDGEAITKDKQEKLALGLIEKKNSQCWNREYYFKTSITWSKVTSGNFSVRFLPEGFIFDVAGCSIFNLDTYQLFICALLNSKIIEKIINIISGTINYEVGTIKSLPIILPSNSIKAAVDDLTFKCIFYSKNDWDSFETSWDFKQHPFLTYRGEAKTLEECYANWADHAEKQFRQLQKNEEELNRIFIELYGLQDELTPEVPDEEVTVRRADRVRDAKSFLSYCIGLMMGRYSLDVEGLAYAGGEWDASKYKTFQPDKDGIIPLTETAYFEDDVITRLQELLIIMFGEETLAENLRWLAESLTMKNNETPTERLRRYFFDEFYDDHCKIYQKRPIYWMVESGSKKGFRALFYLHRYKPETLAAMRFTYVQNLQEKLRQEEKRLEQDLINPDLSAAMKKRYEKQLKQIIAQQEELVEFDKKLAELANQRIALDLDDGVVVNYKKLKGILAKIK